MKFKDFVIPVGLALLTTWVIQHYVLSPSGSQQAAAVKSGQGFVAPKEKRELKPLNTEIDFYDNEAHKELQHVIVETHGAKLVFSNHGASLDSIEFMRINGSIGGGSLSTITAPTEGDRDNRCLLVALNQKTPYYYDLVAKQDSQDKVELTYQAETPDALVQKKFTVYKNSFKLDVDLTLEPKNGMALDARVFFPSPQVTDIAKYDVISVVVSNEKGSVTKIGRDSLTPEQGWFAPTLFGTDDHYFVHAYVEASNDFVQRAYTMFSEKQKQGIVSILEGPSVAQKQTWRLSFFFGPKEGNAMALVDPRLEQTLDYSGFFAPISKFLLYILKLIYHYVKNYGFAIIVLTLLVKLILLPFTFHAEESMKKRMEFDKKLKYIQQKYKENPEMLAKERAELIQKHGMPGLSGCLPLLLQIPIFIALSRVLSSAIELYKAPFVFWITDLSVKDPYYILPLVIVIGMIMQQLTTVSSADPKQRLSAFAMALIIGAVTSSLAAGLALYICTFTLFGVAQTYIVRAFKRS